MTKEAGIEIEEYYRDIATFLARIPRWAGTTLIPWSVLQHTLMMERM